MLEHFKDGARSAECANRARYSLSHYFPHFQHVFKHPVLNTLSRSLFQIHLTNARIKNFVWDANIVIDALRDYPPYSELPLAWHSVKLVLLILLSTMARKQVLEMLDINHMTFHDASVEFVLQGRQKQFHVGNVDHAHTVLELFPYPVDDKICPVRCLIEYLNATKYVRPPDQAGLFLRAIPPFTNVKKATFAGWVKKGLLFAGIDLNQFKLHSTHAASSSTAFHAGIPVNEVLLRAGWSSISTFMRFYGRSVRSVPGVSIVHLCFFGTNKGRAFLARHHDQQCTLAISSLMSSVQDQNPARQHRGDPVLQHDPAAHNAPKKKDPQKRPSVFQNSSIDISPSEVPTASLAQSSSSSSEAENAPVSKPIAQKKTKQPNAPRKMPQGKKKSSTKKPTQDCIPYALWKNKSPQMTPQLQPGPVKVRFIDAWGKPIVQNPTPPIMQETAEQGTAKITIKIPGLPNKIITVPPKVKEVPPCQKYPTLASRLACPPPIIAPPMLVSLTAEEMEMSIASQEIVETTHTSTRVSLFKTACKKLCAKFVQARQKLWIAKNIRNIILQRKKLHHLYTKNYSLWNTQKEVLFASSPLLHLCPHANLPPEDMSDSELSHTTVVSSAIHSRN